MYNKSIKCICGIVYHYYSAYPFQNIPSERCECGALLIYSTTGEYKFNTQTSWNSISKTFTLNTDFEELST